jgi:hypothetical protein
LNGGASGADLAVTVVDPQPLAEWRGRLQTALQELAAARATANASRLEQSRVQALFDDNRSASQRALETANALAQTDAARERSAQSQVIALRDSARATWGPIVAGWLEAADGTALQRLLSGREALLRAALRADDTARTPARLNLTPPGRSEPVTARGLGTVAPGAAEATAGGRHLLFLAPGAGLATGMRLSARSPGSGDEASREGGLVPPRSDLARRTGLICARGAGGRAGRWVARNGAEPAAAPEPPRYASTASSVADAECGAPG